MDEAPLAFAFAGGGLAGLTLAAELAAAFPDRRIVVVDQDGFEGPPRFDRSIGFWCEGEPPFAELVVGSWSTLGVDGPGGHHQLALEPLRYHALHWSTLRAALLTKLCEHATVELRAGRVVSILDLEGPGAALVLDSGETIEAEFVLDSRLDITTLSPAPGRVLAFQRFCGLEIETPEDRFDPARASFMDLRPSTPERVAFINLLPRGRRRALVYHVEFAPTREGPSLREAVAEDLARYLGVERFEVHAEERGVLPLSDQAWQRRLGDATLRIGNVGGRLKPSTAYAFTRILADNQAILASLREHGHPFALPREPARYRWLDGTLLELLVRRPALGPAVFEGMFRRARPAALFALLDDRASIAQLVEIMLAVPYKLRLALGGLRRLLAWCRSPRRALTAASTRRQPDPQLPPS